MKITNIHTAATAQVHGHSLGPGQNLEGEVAENLLRLYPGVGAMFGCGVLEGDDEATAFVRALKTGAASTAVDKINLPTADAPKQQKGKPGPKPKASTAAPTADQAPAADASSEADDSPDES